MKTIDFITTFSCCSKGIIPIEERCEYCKYTKLCQDILDVLNKNSIFPPNGIRRLSIHVPPHEKE